MNGIVIIITLAVLLAIIVIGWLLYAFQGRGKSVNKGFENVQKAANVADTVTDIAAAIAPNQITSTLQKIADAAKIGVNSAEQMYLNGSITADQRKAEAEKVLKTALGLDGIAYEGDVASLGNSAMEAAVRALPKTGIKKAAPTAAPAAQTA